MNLDIDPRNLRAWLIGARSREVRPGKITARGIMGQTLIFYRTPDGRAVAQDGRCPHKGVSLAQGKLRHAEVQCPYHGWRFNAAGDCTHVPSTAPDEALPCARLQVFPVVEQDGWIWIYWGGAPVGEPPRYPLDERYGWFETVKQFVCPPHFILENSFDGIHANYAHGNLLRGDPVQQVEAKMAETPRGVEIATTERPGKKSMLIPVPGEFRTTAELVLPFTAFTNVRYGKLHHVTILTCVPIDAERTRVYTRTGVHSGLLTPLVSLFFRAVTPFVIAQDIRILENQARTFRQYGGKYGFARQADVPAFWAMRAYRNFLEGQAPGEGELRTGEVVYKL